MQPTDPQVRCFYGSSATDRGRIRRNRSLDAFGWDNRISGDWTAETAAIQIEEKPAFDEVAPSARVPVRKHNGVSDDLRLRLAGSPQWPI
jgi:hypothetical protein